jgi:phosphatidylserine decarboxylase
VISIPALVTFCRDPTLPLEEGIVSPADGRISGIDRSGDRVVIKVFMNIWHIHVNRSPVGGKVQSVVHTPGGHRPAFSKDAGTNERVIIDLETEIGKVKVVQIAGSFARRIVPYVGKGHTLEPGERIGIIRFGSRVDTHLPEGKVDILVKAGDRVRPGQAIARVRTEEGSP